MVRIRKNIAFTLLELLIVVVILAVLAGLALPQYLRTVGRARESEGWQMLGAIRSATSRYYAEWNDLTGLTVSGGLLDIEDPNLPVNRLFDYSYTAVGPDLDFTIEAAPTAGCGGCQTLSIDHNGVRSQVP